MLGNSGTTQVVHGVMMGNSESGKTAVGQRLMGQGFTTKYKDTIGAGFVSVYLPNMRLQLWDVAGNEKFHPIAKAFFRDAAVCFLCVDVNSEKPADQINSWLGITNDHVESEVPVYVIGTKGDLIDSKTSPDGINQNLSDICNKMTQFKNIKKVSYLGIYSSKSGDSYGLPSESKTSILSEGGILSRMKNLAADELTIRPETKKEKDEKRDNSKQSEVTPAVPQTGEGTLEDPTQSLLGASTQSSSRFFTIPLKANWRKTRLAIRLGMSVVATGGLFPSLFMACALLSYAGESFKDNQIKQKSRGGYSPL